MSGPDYRRLLKALWRRRLWVLVPSGLGLAGGFAALAVLPPVYRASTLVLVEPQKVPEDYVKPTITTPLHERLKTLEQQITNRNNLAQIIREAGLHPELRAAGDVEEALRQTRRALALEVQGNKVFRIYFKAADPETAAAVANRVAELFIEQNLRLRRSQAQGTSEFLASELAAMKRQLETREREIAAFKQLHIAALPEQRETNLRAVEQLQAKLQINLDARDKAELRKLYLQREAAASSPEAVASGPQRLQELRAQLAHLRSLYTDRHPDVRRLSAEIDRLQSLPVEPVRPAPPTHDPVLAAELQAVNLEIRQLESEKRRILEDIASYQARLEHTPQVELELLDLSRDYDNLRRSYEQLLAKRIEADLAENLEKRQQSEQFTILENAVPPESPYAPNRPLIAGASLLLGCGLGIGLALLRQETDRTYRDAEELRRAFPGAPLLAEVPALPTAARRPRLRRNAS